MSKTSLAFATLLAAAATTTSCAVIIGLNQDYQETSSASGSGGATSSSGAMGGNSGSNSGASSGSGVLAMPGCTGLLASCGPNGKEDCCATSQVAGGMFNRDNNMMYPATISSFKLDRFEVTVGRFRRFAEAYPGSKPQADAGKHPKIAGSGWNAIWAPSLPKDKATLINEIITNCNHPPDPYFPTWTDMPGANEDKPINCISWYVAFAFCAWDGGRLPTNAELSYAQSGGSEQRMYPWGSMSPDGNYAVFNCMGDNSAAQDCKASDIVAVGSRSPTGDGKFMQADLAGNVWEWVLDSFDTYPTPCVDCATLGPSTQRTMRGGGWGNNGSLIASDYTEWPVPTTEGDALGVRCARD